MPRKRKYKKREGGRGRAVTAPVIHSNPYQLNQRQSLESIPQPINTAVDTTVNAPVDTTSSNRYPGLWWKIKKNVPIMFMKGLFIFMAIIAVIGLILFAYLIIFTDYFSHYGKDKDDYDNKEKPPQPED